MKKLFLILTVIISFASCGTNKTTEKDSSKISVQLIRNATLKLKYNGQMFMVDPSLSPKHSFMSFVVPNKNLNPTVDLPISLDEITKNIDAVLVTHTHLDHFDEGAQKNLNHQLPLFGQPYDKEKLEKSPFKNINIIENNTIFNGVEIIRTKGKHGPDHMLKALGEVSGFVLKAKNSPTIYIVGDCLFDNDIKNTITQHNPDIIIVNSGGAEFGGERILMNEKRAVSLAKFAPKAQIIAVHMEALDHCKTTRQMIRDEAKKEKVTMLVPNDGELIEL